MFKKILLWIAVIGMSAMIFGFSSHTGEQSSGLSEKLAETIIIKIEKIIGVDLTQKNEVFEMFHFILRKSAHFAEYAVLGLLSFLLVESYGFSIKICAVSALLYCFLFAACDEAHQLFVDGRSGSITDVFVDFAGSFLGIMLCMIVFWYKKKKKIQY